MPVRHNRRPADSPSVLRSTVASVALLGWLLLPSALASQSVLFKLQSQVQWNATIPGRVGDLNRDGYPDLAVGMPILNSSRNGKALYGGCVHVYSGRDMSLLYELWGDTLNGDWLGASISPAGDFNRDGSPDILVGMPMAPGSVKTLILPGAARIYSGKDGRRLATFYGNSSREGFGSNVALIGDVDKDGRRDLLIAAPYETGCG